VKRVNLKLLLTLVAATVIAVVGVYFLRRFQITRNAGGLAKLARQRLDEGKPAEALLLFQRYVGLRPEDKEAYGEYAELLLRKTEGPEVTRADLARAYAVLEEAIRRDPANDALRARLARFQLRIGRFGDAREHLRVLREHVADGTIAAASAAAEPAAEKADVDALTDPDSIALMLARAHLGMGEFEPAATIAGELVGFDLESRSFGDEPQTGAPTDAYVVLAAILAEKLEDTAAANRVLDQLVKVRPDDATAWLALSRWHRQQGDAAAATRDLDKALELGPDNPDVLFAAFDLCAATGDASRAEKLARQGREAFPGDERGYRALAGVCLQQGRADEAEQTLRDGVAALPTRAPLLLMLADVQLQRGEVEEAEQTLSRVREQLGPTNPAVGLFEARILVARQQWLQARERLREVRPLVAGMEDLTRQVDLYLGQCAEQLGEFDEQLAANQRVLSDSPTSLPARVGAASALMAAGKNDEALAEYEAVAAGVPADKLAGIPQIWLPLLQLRVAAQARRPAEKRDWSKIDALLESLQQAPEVSAAQIALLRADVLVRKDELDAAEAVLAKGAAAEPANPQLAASRAALALRREGPAAARGLLDALPEDVSGHPAVLSVSAQVAAAAGGEAALQSFAQIAERARTLPAEPASRLLSQVAGLSLALGDREAAERLWTEAAEKQPEDAQARSALFELALDSGDLAKARTAAEALRKAAGAESPQGFVARAAVAITSVRQSLAARQEPGGPMPELTAAEKQQLDEARNLLVEAENARPGWGRIQSMYAEVEGLKGDVAAAIDRLQRAINLGTTNPAVIRQLVSLLYATNRIDEARRALASIGPEAAGLERLAAEVELRSGKAEEAVAIAEKTVAADSKNADELLWFGQLLERAGKRERAAEVVERAVAAAPSRPDAWLSLVSLQVAAGRKKAAEQTLDRSADSLADPQRGTTLAQGNEMLGRFDEAERYYREAAAAAPGDVAIRRRLAEFLLRAGRLAPARETLDAIVAAQAQSPADRATQAWARRVVAELVGERGTFRDFQAALRTLQLNADAKGQLGLEDLALKARLLAARPEPANWREGIETFDALARIQPLSTGQKLQLADLQERIGRWDECRDGLVSIASSPQTPPAIMARLIEKLVDHGELSAARTWLRRLQTAAPDAPMTLAVEAKVAIAAGDREAAKSSARKLMPVVEAAGDRAEDMRTIAQLYEELGFIKAADTVLARLAEASAEGTVARAAFLGRQKQTAAALDLLETCWDKASLERLLQVAVEVARDAEDPTAAARIDPWFAKAMRQDPESITLPLLLAEIRDLQGRPADTESIYRGILDRERLDPIARAIVTNNLAFHLARPETAAEARKLIDAAIDELGPHPDLLDTRGMVELAAGDARQALKDLQEATLQPTAVKLLHLACAQFASGDAETAVRTLEDARRKQLRSTRLSSADRERLGALEAALARPAA
jgi:tetratricopeptide (TPR) repeat protein